MKRSLFFAKQLFSFSYLLAITFVPLQANFSSMTIAQLDLAFEQAFSQSELVGLTAGVWVGDEIVWVRTEVPRFQKS